jgi:hypothetical protein
MLCLIAPLPASGDPAKNSIPVWVEITPKPTENERLGLEALQLCEQSLEVCRRRADGWEQYAKSVETQRNEAIKAVRPESALPWWGWLVIGAAGGVILTRGLR